MCESIYFPLGEKMPRHLADVVAVFKKNDINIDSNQHRLKSDDVLSTIMRDLIALEYEVETDKRNLIPFHVCDEDGQPLRRVNPDAYNKKHKTIIEVEAGRAVDNNQYLKDLVFISALSDIDYLVLAVRRVYSKKDNKRKKENKQYDYKNISKIMRGLFANISFPLRGVVLIGY